jgi:hypothetical protein
VLVLVLVLGVSVALVVRATEVASVSGLVAGFGLSTLPGISLLSNK